VFIFYGYIKKIEQTATNLYLKHLIKFSRDEGWGTGTGLLQSGKELKNITIKTGTIHQKE
jgi:hypothetical protein